MKDAQGHGSNPHGSRKFSPPQYDEWGITPKPMSGGRTNERGGQPVSSNAHAAQALMGSLKSTQAPVHPAMQSGHNSEWGWMA